jgi:hypothetical protein
MLHATLALALMVAPPREPTPGRKLVIAGGITLAVGGASLATGIGLIAPSNRLANQYAGAASPGDTGFPSARYSDLRGVEHRMHRLNVAVRALAITGAILIVAGAVVMITGGAIKRQARRDHARLRFSPDLTLRF